MASTIAKTATGIGRKAQIWQGDNYFQVRLYQTMVYEENREKGTLTLCHGGWVTPTTARYINQALAHRGSSNRVAIRKGEMVLLCSRDVVPFQGDSLVIELQKNQEVA